MDLVDYKWNLQAFMKTFRALRSKTGQMHHIGFKTEQIGVELLEPFFNRYWGDDPLLQKTYKNCIEIC